MKHSTTWLLLGIATVLSAAAVGVTHLLGGDASYYPAVVLGSVAAVLCVALVVLLPAEEERPIARARPREDAMSGGPDLPLPDDPEDRPF